MPSESPDLNALAWDAARLGEAIQLLARKARLLLHAAQDPSQGALPGDLDTTDSAALAQWVKRHILYKEVLKCQREK
jgi:hypothetical protein